MSEISYKSISKAKATRCKSKLLVSGADVYYREREKITAKKIRERERWMK